MTLFDQRPVRPMLSTPGEAFDSDEYLFEPKWDGLRALLFKRNGLVELQNRNLRIVSSSYPELQALKMSIEAQSAIVDGEVVVLNKRGLPSFQMLQPRFGLENQLEANSLSKTRPVTFVAFDLLHLNGKDLLDHHLEERKDQLRRIVREGPFLLFSDHVRTHGIKFFKLATKKGLEGIVGKKLDSKYVPGTRSSFWVKVKSLHTIDCIIVGYTTGEGARSTTFGSLVLAVHDENGEFKHIGNVGGGFNAQTLVALRTELAAIEKNDPLIKGKVESNTPVTWVKPTLVCEVEYGSMTDDKKLRFPRFKRLRTDLDPSKITL